MHASSYWVKPEDVFQRVEENFKIVKKEEFVMEQRDLIFLSSLKVTYELT